MYSKYFVLCILYKSVIERCFWILFIFGRGIILYISYCFKSRQKEYNWRRAKGGIGQVNAVLRCFQGEGSH